ncbi:DUF6611 family protein [Gordonia insulae]|uniref:Uncharacterized protein n=1 Tax=Gordonia insulae TaxID=2420509 RepID=A0A3G8JS88_9ACTN|nr:DUF6611 family protein [Gordonia insulae]AZG47783.1 hypothetical protein D7316_04395 [Gordonia insulae]
MSDAIMGHSRRMTPTTLTHASGLWSRVLTGPDTWGTLRVGYARHWAQYRVAVYPPGIDDGQRVRLRAWRAAPVWGFLLWLAVWTAFAAIGVGYAVSIPASIVITALVIARSAAAASTTRRFVRQMTVWTGEGEEPTSSIERDRLLRMVDLLRRTDADLRAGRISPVEHETVWAGCYAELAG